MGYSQAQKAESKRRVLEVASRQIRENGIEALGVADCMRSAGLTHGAFYGHFASRDALILEALEHALNQSEKRMASTVPDVQNEAQKEAQTPLASIAQVFLNERHAKNPGKGCALCALAGEARHADADVRALLERYVQQLASRIAKATGKESEDAGLGIVATIVGAITLARMVDHDDLAKSILASSLALVMSQDNGAALTSDPAQTAGAQSRTAD